MGKTKDKKTILYDKIKNCNKCNRGEYTPFCFELKSQKVAVITARPSIQAEYKPLHSIRFFRKMCIALFGDANISVEYLKAFSSGNIYWTHYYKCYNQDNSSFCNIPDICAKEYLKKEIELLTPEVIVVFGDEIQLQVKDALKGLNIQTIIYKPFPQKGNESIYDDVRHIVRNYVDFMDCTGNNISTRYSYPPDNSNGMDVHMKFEVGALEQILSGKTASETYNIEEVWYRKVVIPNMEMYEKVILTYSFIENQVKTSLFNYILRTGNCTFLTSIKNMSIANSPIIYENIHKEIKNSNSFLNNFEEYIKFAFRNKNCSIISKIRKLNIIRNCIVHDFGYIKNYDRFCDVYDLEGFNIIGKTLYIDKNANNELLNITKEVIRLLEE